MKTFVKVGIILLLLGVFLAIVLPFFLSCPNNPDCVFDSHILLNFGWLFFFLGFAIVVFFSLYVPSKSTVGQQEVKS
jgi:hypothetical protein